jgi:hypothetical protein
LIVAALEVFDNRETALLIWLVVGCLATLLIPGVRREVPFLLKTLFSPVLVVPFLVAAGYVALVVFMLAQLGLWTTAVLDVTLFWFFGPGMAAFAGAGMKAGEPALTRTLLRKAIPWVLLVEFVANLYVFSLPVELLFVPCIASVVLLDAVAEMKPELAPARNLTSLVLGVFAVFLLVRAAVIIASDPAGFASSENALRFLVPILLSLGFLPFAYLLPVFALYSDAFARLDVMSGDRARARFARRAMLRAFHLDRMKLARFAGPGLREVARAADQQEVEEVIRRAA